MERYDIIVIGGGPAGIITAGTARSYYPDKSVLVIRKEDVVMVPCGIPYIFGTIKVEKNVIPDEAVTKPGSHLLIDEVIDINLDKKMLKTKGGKEFEYDKLVYASGSLPVEPGWLKGKDKDNVFYVRKNGKYLDEAKKKLQDLNKVVIIGGGFIGVEVADEINKMGKEVTIVEKLPYVLNLAMDKEMCEKVQDILAERKVNLKTNSSVKEILGKDKVEGVLLEDGTKIDCDAVFVSVGYKPNTVLLEKAGMKLGFRGAIPVDEYMRTEHEDVFAVGDCVERKSFATRKISGVMLASTAVSEARIAGANLYKLQVLKTFMGTIGIFSTKIGDYAFASAGITEREAREEGFDIEIGVFEGVDRHPGCLPGAHKQFVKLIVAKKSGILMGGQVYGGDSVGEMINMIGVMIQQKMNIHEILGLQIGTHPLLTSAPTVYPLVKAAEKLIPKVK